MKKKETCADVLVVKCLLKGLGAVLISFALIPDAGLSFATDAVENTLVHKRGVLTTLSVKLYFETNLTSINLKII